MMMYIKQKNNIYKNKNIYKYILETKIEYFNAFIEFSIYE